MFLHPRLVGLILYAPSPTVADEKVPATVLVVTDDGWLVASENQDGGINVEQCKFNDTLFVELTSIVLLGQLKIDFASTGICTVLWYGLARPKKGSTGEAIYLVLDGIDRTRTSPSEKPVAAEMLKEWPLKFRNEGQRLLAATQWPAILGGFRRELAPADALLVTERELVLRIRRRLIGLKESGPSTAASSHTSHWRGWLIFM
jgi:hypothetical protein